MLIVDETVSTVHSLLFSNRVYHTIGSILFLLTTYLGSKYYKGNIKKKKERIENCFIQVYVLNNFLFCGRYINSNLINKFGIYEVLTMKSVLRREQCGLV